MSEELKSEKGKGRRAQGTGHRAQGTELRAQNSGHRAQSTESVTGRFRLSSDRQGDKPARRNSVQAGRNGDKGMEFGCRIYTIDLFLIKFGSWKPASWQAGWKLSPILLVSCSPGPLVS